MSMIHGLTLEEIRQIHEEAGEQLRIYAKKECLSGDYKWPELLSPFDHQDTPSFPTDALPRQMAEYCKANSEASGFDVGAYAFSLFLYAASLVDHRHKLDVGPFKTPAFLWGGLVDRSGGGKSPVLKSARRFVDEYNGRLCASSSDRLQEYHDDCRVLGSRKKDQWPDKPRWEQFIGVDTTSESLGDCIQAMPSGILLGAEEITELIGRMDAYSSGAGGKDRGLYLRAYDGGFSTINRKSNDTMVFKNFSFAIVAGMQPKKLAELFRKNSGSSDGLYQRFMLYQMRPPKQANYSGRVQGAIIDECRKVFQHIEKWRWMEDVSKHFRLCDAARMEMEGYHNACRAIATTGGGEAFSEHVNKFPGFLGRVTLALHFCECADAGVLHHQAFIQAFTRLVRAF